MFEVVREARGDHQVAVEKENAGDHQNDQDVAGAADDAVSQGQHLRRLLDVCRRSMELGVRQSARVHGVHVGVVQQFFTDLRA